MSLVIRSSTTVASAAQANTCRSAPFAIFLFLLAGDTQSGMGQGVQALKIDLLPALLAVAELVGGAVQPAQRLVHVPEIAAFLGSKEKLLLPLHRIGSLVRHVKRIGGEIAIGRLQRRVEGLVVIA